MNKFKIAILFLFTLLLASCGGGGGGGSDSPVDDENPDTGTTEQQIGVTVSPVEGLELDGKDYIITMDDKSAPLSSGSLTTTIKANPSDVSIVTLATEFGEPILISYSNTNNKKAELSVESSADVFVMRSPRFYGVKINDMEELSKRIRAHSKYAKLVRELSERIKNSPCPMDSSCSALASNTAEKIAQDINFLDLIDKG